MAVTDTDALAAGFAVPADDAPVHEAPSYFRQNARAAAPGAWTAVTNINANMSADGTGVPPHGVNLRVRLTPLGVQIRGKYLINTSIPMDALLFTLPTEFRPLTPIREFVSGQGSGSVGYAPYSWQVDIKTDGSVTARQSMSAGYRVSFDNHYQLYDD